MSMQIIEVSKLYITPDRQRKEFDPNALGELSELIRVKGLMHAVVTRDIVPGTMLLSAQTGQPVASPDPKGRILVAGERRLRAILDMWMLGGHLRYNDEPVPEDFIPYTTLGQLSALEAEEAEWEENYARKDLTWQESAAAKSKLHKLRSQQAQAEGRIHTVADTAVELTGRSDGAFQERVRKDLIVAQHLHNPAIAAAKSTDEAFKILKRQENTQRNVELAAAVGKTFSSDVHRILNVNCLDWMRTADAEQFDVILTDPPYGMGADTFGDGGDGRLANNEHHYKDDFASFEALMKEWCPLAFRVAKPEAHAYVFCDIDNFRLLREWMRAAGWYVFRTPFICTKPNSGRVPLPDQGPRRQYETLLYAIKGKKKTTAIYPDVITTYADAGLQHGAQKPVALYEDLLRRSVRPGDSVLDSFGGSGTLLPAAHAFKCKATVLEMNPEYYGICLQRAKTLDTVQEGQGLIVAGVGSAQQGKDLGNELLGLLGRG
jgi:DNA modification methylase